MSAPPRPDFTGHVAGTAAPLGPSADAGGCALDALRRRNDIVHWHGRDERAREFVRPSRPHRDRSAEPALADRRPEDRDDQTTTGLWFDATGTPQLDPADRTATDGVALLCRRYGLDCT